MGRRSSRRPERVFSAEKEGNSLVQCEVKQKMPKSVGKMAGRGKKMLFLCQCVAGRMVKSFLPVPFSLTQVITKQPMLLLRKKIIKFHFENVKTKCFGISEVKHFIKNVASECFDIFKIRSPPPPPIFSA